MAAWKGHATCCCFEWTQTKCEGEDCTDSEPPDKVIGSKIGALCSVCQGKAKRKWPGLPVAGFERVFFFDGGFPDELQELKGKGKGSMRMKNTQVRGWKKSPTLGVHVLDLYVYSNLLGVKESAKQDQRAIICREGDEFEARGLALLEQHAERADMKFPRHSLSLQHYGGDHKTKLFIYAQALPRGTLQPASSSQQQQPRMTDFARSERTPMPAFGEGTPRSSCAAHGAPSSGSRENCLSVAASSSVGAHGRKRARSEGPAE